MESIRSGHDVGGVTRARPILSAEGLALLQNALASGVADRDSRPSPKLQEALSHICGEAKLKNWPPESLLIVLKTALETVPAVRRLTRGPERDEMVASIVSMLIDEYYGTSRR